MTITVCNGPLLGSFTAETSRRRRRMSQELPYVFLCLRSDGIVVVVSYLRKRQWTSSFQDEVVALCVCVCVFSFAHDTCLRDVPGNSAKRE